MLGVSPLIIVLCSIVLFSSHFFEDTYVPVYWWAKYIRRVPELQTKDGWVARRNFADWVKTPLGAILMIAIDQIIHIYFLWVPVIAVLCK